MGHETSNDWPWSDEDKRSYVWNRIKEAAQRGGENTGTYTAYTVKDEGEYDPIFLDHHEQRLILQDLAAEGKIRLLGQKEGEKRQYNFEILEPSPVRESAYSHRIRTLADLVKDIELRNRVMKIIVKAFGVYDAREIRANQSVRTDIHESEDEILLLTDELGLTETDWDSLRRQTHRVIGNRYVNVFFKSDVAKKLADAISGRSSSIHTKAVDQVALLIKDLMSQEDLNDFFIQLGVPYSLLLDNQHSKKDLVYNVILALSSTGEEEDKGLLDSIFEELAHPRTFQGDTKKALDFQYKVTKVIRYDHLSLLGGKIHSFTENDEAQMMKLEEKEHAIDPTLAKSINDLFGGFAAPRRSTSKQPEKTSPPEKQGTPTTHIHIHNDHKVTQSIQVPVSSPENTNSSRGLHEKTSLAGVAISFDDNKACLTIGDKTCQLPQYKNEHYFCRAVFAYPKDEPIDWSIILDKMTGEKRGKSAERKIIESEKRSVYDTARALNVRVMEVADTNDKLFIWSEKTVTRAF